MEVRDANFKRVGSIPASDLDLTCAPEHNNVGAWDIVLPSEHPMAKALAMPGSGVIISTPDDVLLSGPMTRNEEAVSPEDKGGTITFSGIGDTHIVGDRLAFPTPAESDPGKQGTGHDTRTGAAETLMHQYVRANVGPDAPAGRRIRQLDMGTDRGRGQTVTKKPRFQNLGELLTELAATDSLGFRVVQRGGFLMFETYQASDRSRVIRLSIESGTLDGKRVAVTPPSVTYVVVAGQGEMTSRQLTGVTTPVSEKSEAVWNRRIEQFLDQRQTSDLNEQRQAALEVLAEGGDTGLTIQAVPPEDGGPVFARDLFFGDLVSAEVRGEELLQAVTGFVVKADRDGFKTGIVLGDVSQLNPAAASSDRISGVESRVSAIERNVEVAMKNVLGRSYPNAIQPISLNPPAGDGVERDAYPVQDIAPPALARVASISFRTAAGAASGTTSCTWTLYVRYGGTGSWQEVDRVRCNNRGIAAITLGAQLNTMVTITDPTKTLNVRVTQSIDSGQTLLNSVGNLNVSFLGSS